MAGKRTGLALVELLIVFALLALMAAVAVPGFVDSQARSRTARARADMRSMAVAVEAYKVDFGWFPFSANDAWWLVQSGSPWGTFVYTTNLALRCATTPVAYLNAVPLDYFGNQSGFPFGSYLYVTEQREYGAGKTVNFNWCPASGYGFGSVALNGAWDYAYGPGLESTVINSIYDPSNGMVSRGDIIRVGPDK
jgi:general secretion pathway protein G